jgi:hypothetical protein
MIFARLIGGLGNQMFQYACARRLAHALQAPLKLDLSAFENYGLRPYALDGLSISAEIAPVDEVFKFRRRARIRSRLPELLSRLIPGCRYEVFKERSFEFDSNVLKLRGNILLEGYWQSERYFNDIADIIRREFTLKGTPSETNASLAARIRSTDAVSIHVRRGDYVSNPETRQVHGTCGLDYYQRAVDKIAGIEPHPHFFVFSDDPAWVKENLRLPFPTVVVERTGTYSPCGDLWLMSLCRHNIIANSSFGWWGAWLNSNPNKKVIAPQKWFNLKAYDTRDLIPAHWIRI